jgi:hypothetical protein
MPDNGNGVATVDRAERLRDYVYMDAISLLIGNLGAGQTNVLEGVVPEEYLGAQKIVLLGPSMSELWPTDDDTESDEFNRTDGLAAVVAGEMFLTLAASSEELAAEGRRLVGLGRRQIEKTMMAKGEESHA